MKRSHSSALDSDTGPSDFWCTVVIELWDTESKVLMEDLESTDHHHRSECDRESNNMVTVRRVNQHLSAD